MSLSEKLNEVITTDTVRSATDAAISYAVSDAWGSIAACSIIGIMAISGAVALYLKGDEYTRPMAWGLGALGVIAITIGVLSSAPAIVNPQGYVIYSALKGRN